MTRTGRTVRLLKFVQGRGSVTARELMEVGGLSHAGAVESLIEASEDGLLKRQEYADPRGPKDGDDWGYVLTQGGSNRIARNDTPVPGPRPSIPRPAPWFPPKPYVYVPWEEDSTEEPRPRNGRRKKAEVPDPEPTIETHEEHVEGFHARGLVTHREAAKGLARSIDAIVGAIRNGAVPIVDYCVCHHSRPTWVKARDHRETWYLRPEDVDTLGVQLRREKYGQLASSSEFEVGVQTRLYNYGLRAARLRLGLTIKQLAQSVGIGPATLGQYENLRAHPRAARAQKIADALQEPVEVLFPPWLQAFKITKGPSILDDRHISLEQVLEAGGASRVLPIGEDEELLRSEEADPRPTIDEVLETLKPREKAVLRYRFGLDDGESHTLEETARQFGWSTSERPRQIEQKALTRLRHPSRSRKLRPWIESPWLT